MPCQLPITPQCEFTVDFGVATSGDAVDLLIELHGTDVLSAHYLRDVFMQGGGRTSSQT
jgi:hypothetical protein